MPQKELPDLPRLMALAGRLGEMAAAKRSYRAWLRDLQQGLLDEPLKRSAFAEIEAILAALDDPAWDFLQGEIVARGHLWSPQRGWQAILDAVNEARAFAYLKAQGCTEVAFMARCTDRKTPDLIARRDGRPVYCEVKTLNVSKEKAKGQLPPHFFRKLRDRARDAAQQLRAEPAMDAFRIAYFIIHFDDALHEQAAHHLAEIHREIAAWPADDIQYVFDVKPPLETAQP